MPPHSNGEAFLNRITEIVGKHLGEEQFGVSELARAAGMSRSNLHRKIHSLTGKSASQFIREVRLNKAHELLQDSGLTVSEVAYRVGFSSATYFSKCFHDHFGYPPGEAAERDVERSPLIDPQVDPDNPGPVKQRNPVRWILPVSILILVTFAVILFLKPYSYLLKPKDVTVAVLPFRNNSPDQQNDYIINGLVEEIQFKLSRVEGLSVVPRTTMELYSDSEKSIRQIARDVDADYIMEGSATILDNQTRIRLQLIDPSTNSNIWSEPYDREITKDNVFEIQEEIALAVTDRLDIVRNQELTDLVQHKPTENPEAYDLYSQARNLMNLNQARPDQITENSIFRIKLLLEKAIDLDSTFADAYVQLSSIYTGTYYYWYFDFDLEKAYAYLDTGLFAAEKAIHFYEKKSNGKRPADQYYQYALLMKAGYYLFNGNFVQADYYYKEARNGAEKTYRDYYGNINWYYNRNDFYSTIKYYLILNKLKPEEAIVDWWIHQAMYEVFRQAGFPELARDQIEDLLIQEGDSLSYFVRITELEMWSGNYPEAIQSIHRLIEQVPDAPQFWETLSRLYLYMGEPDTAAQIILDMRARKEDNVFANKWLAGYIFKQLGQVELADSLVKMELEFQLSRLQYSIPSTLKGITPFIIARDYSIIGNKEKAMEYLDYLKGTPGADYYFIHELKNWPSFDLVLETPEYKEILSDLEKRYRKEHERIERLLKREGYI